jgi:hypothetical protein
MQKWEYKYLTRTRNSKSDLTAGAWEMMLEDGNSIRAVPIENRLAELGRQGWELVNVHPLCSVVGEGYAGFTTSEKWVFKRPIE